MKTHSIDCWMDGAVSTESTALPDPLANYYDVLTRDFAQAVEWHGDEWVADHWMPMLSSRYVVAPCRDCGQMVVCTPGETPTCIPCYWRDGMGDSDE